MLPTPITSERIRQLWEKSQEIQRFQKLEKVSVNTLLLIRLDAKKQGFSITRKIKKII
jgi:RNase P subunit RPR2